MRKGGWLTTEINDINQEGGRLKESLLETSNEKLSQSEQAPILARQPQTDNRFLKERFGRVSKEC